MNWKSLLPWTHERAATKKRKAAGAKKAPKPGATKVKSADASRRRPATIYPQPLM